MKHLNVWLTLPTGETAHIGNTDDHLKNFLLLRDAHGWRLSPAFDLVPDIGRNREHTLAIGYSRETPSRNDLVAIGQRWLNHTRPSAAHRAGGRRGREQVSQYRRAIGRCARQHSVFRSRYCRADQTPDSSALIKTHSSSIPRL